MSSADELRRLPEKRKTKGSVWLCSECGYRNSDRISQNCMNCGRDISGAPGRRPDEEDRTRI